MVLLILAGISIGMIFGENGLISRATGSAEEYEKAELKEKIELLLSEYVMENVTRENTNFEEFLRKIYKLELHKIMTILILLYWENGKLKQTKIKL